MLAQTEMLTLPSPWPYTAFARHSSNKRAALPAIDWSVGAQPSARARGLRTTWSSTSASA